MNKTAFWKTDWFVALMIFLVLLAFSSSAIVVGLERAAYDWGLRATSGEANERIAIIAIDDESLANLGRWPWPRDYHAEMIDLLSGAGAKVIGYTAFFFEPDQGFAHAPITAVGFFGVSVLLIAEMIFQLRIEHGLQRCLP